jgi:hypothetical protein
MKRFALVLFLAAACGGGNKSSTTPTGGTDDVVGGGGGAAGMAAPDCKTAAEKQAGGDAAIASALEAKCASDAWDDAARMCLAEKPDTECTLTDAQKAGIAEARAPKAEPAAAAPPPTPVTKDEAPKTRGAVKKKDKGDGKTADPDEGGE